jgi:hypothetical protein
MMMTVMLGWYLKMRRCEASMTRYRTMEQGLVLRRTKIASKTYLGEGRLAHPIYHLMKGLDLGFFA